MGMIGGLIGRIAGGAPEIGRAARNVAEVFTPNATRRMELSHAAYVAALDAAGAEFAHPREGWFDRFVNGLNRLPRPALALGTLALMVYAMAEPTGFARRMDGLGAVPEPLWWLLGAVVSFYFGAREAHHFRTRRPRPPAAPLGTPAHAPALADTGAGLAGADAGQAGDNPALTAMKARAGA